MGKFEVKKLTNKRVGNMRIPARETVAVFDKRKDAEEEANKRNLLMPDLFIVDEINENGAARELPKVMAKAA